LSFKVKGIKEKNIMLQKCFLSFLKIFLTYFQYFNIFLKLIFFIKMSFSKKSFLKSLNNVAHDFLKLKRVLFL